MENIVKKSLDAVYSGLKHLFVKRLTLYYPEEKLDIPGEGYRYDARQSVGLAGFKGRHLLHMDRCTGCQLCSITCRNIARAIEMVPVEGEWPKNKKSIFPQIDYGRCVFCGLCVDSCTFSALEMTNFYELSSYDKESLIFTPKQLSMPPPPPKVKAELKIGRRGAYHE